MRFLLYTNYYLCLLIIMVYFFNQLFKQFGSRHLSTVNNIHQHDKLLHNFYTQKIRDCRLCHKNNKCDTKNIYYFDFKNGYTFKNKYSTKHLYCVKNSQIS